MMHIFLKAAKQFSQKPLGAILVKVARRIAHLGHTRVVVPNYEVEEIDRALAHHAQLIERDHEAYRALQAARGSEDIRQVDVAATLRAVSKATVDAFETAHPEVAHLRWAVLGQP